MVQELCPRMKQEPQILEQLLERIIRLEGEVAYLRAENQYLRSEVTRLERQLEKYEAPKNSRNSNKPPSSDFPKQQKTQSLRQPTGKKPGGQTGHEGTTLKQMSSPDKIEPHMPLYCNCCGEDLSGQPSFFSGKRQVIDIPPIKAIVTEHQLFDRRCKCGHLNRASYPAGVNAPVSYGENVQALLSYLGARQYVPFQRLSELMRDVFGLGISTGGINYIMAKMEKKAAGTYEAIRQVVIHSHVVGADETGANINGKNHWAWTFQNKRATYIAMHPSRGHKAIESIIPEGLPKSVLVTDCWPTYFNVETQTHQLCTAHLLRELVFLKEKYPLDQWAQQLSQLITDSLSLRKEDNISKDKADKILESFGGLLTNPPSSDSKDLVAFHKRMAKYAGYLFNFLTDKEIPPDNNGSERAIRNFKIKLKVSGFFKSLDGANVFASLRSIIDTAIKNGQNPYQILCLVANCNPATE